MAALIRATPTLDTDDDRPRLTRTLVPQTVCVFDADVRSVAIVASKVSKSMASMTRRRSAFQGRRAGLAIVIGPSALGGGETGMSRVEGVEDR